MWQARFCMTHMMGASRRTKGAPQRDDLIIVVEVCIKEAIENLISTYIFCWEILQQKSLSFLPDQITNILLDSQE